ncbi:MAG: mechanosensitive ion channel [Chromatiales bacterium]|nr:mechanosensitive ion channel [Chromatiales bacterium]
MNRTLLTHGLALLLCTFLALDSAAQEDAQNAEPVAPDLSSLKASWWTYFDGDRAEVEPRVATFLEKIGPQIAELDPSNQVVAEADLKAVRDNFNAYLELLDDSKPEPRELPPAPEIYTIPELLELGAAAREARSDAAEALVAAERPQRTLQGASRRRDAAFDAYVGAAAGDARWLAALKLLQARSSQAIAERRYAFLDLRLQHAEAYADAIEIRLDLARGQLAATAGEADLDKLRERLATSENAVAVAREEVRAAELAASSLDLETAQGRSQQRLLQQLLIQSRVSEALAEVTLAQEQALLWWGELQTDGVADIAAIEEDALGWSELARSLGQQKPEWKRETEDEALAVQSTDREGMDKASIQLLNQRLSTAQETLNWLGDLDENLADLELLRAAVDTAVATSAGRFKSGLAALSRHAKAVYLRVVGLTDLTLFSVGEAPVTGGDILRVLIIIGLAYLLSRGVRHAIGRVGANDLRGTHASLYTVGRLTHYTIIIFAVLIALSSIGLDFSNLALVAGALSVGIGFGLQSIVSNFVSGLIILFEQTLRVGDYIELDTGITGTVKAINVRSTLINTNDNIDIVVPNSEFVTSRLTNWTLGETILRIRIPFGVAYGTDKELVKKAALEAVEQVPYTLTHMKDRVADVWLVEYGDSSLNFLLLVWVNRQGARRPTRTRAAYLWALETKLAEYGIEIPFPQRDLHLRSGFTAAPAPHNPDA